MHTKKQHIYAPINSLLRGRWGCNLELIILRFIWQIYIMSISCEIVIRWLPQDLTSDKSTLVQIMAWCCQATSHYLSQCWPRSLSPHHATMPQWIKQIIISLKVDYKNPFIVWTNNNSFSVTPYATIFLPNDWRFFSTISCFKFNS